MTSPAKWLVNRYINTGASDLAVARFFYHRMKGLDWNREERRRCYRMAMEQHHANQQIYREFIQRR